MNENRCLPKTLETTRISLKTLYTASIHNLCPYPSVFIVIWFRHYEEYVKEHFRQVGSSVEVYGQLNAQHVKAIRQLRNNLDSTIRPAWTDQSNYRHNFWKIHLPLINPYCDICESVMRLVMHHKHYRVWGHETFNDVSLLCNRCHGLVHTWSFPYNALYLPHEKNARKRKKFGTIESVDATSPKTLGG